MIIAEDAPAKINLALHVRRRRDDGYHEIESVFAFTALGDRLTAAPADTAGLTIDGPWAPALAPDPDNLVLTAAAMVAEAVGIEQQVAFHLVKNLPVAAGIGGGSADAAAAIRIMIRMFGIEGSSGQFGALAARVGADVPACLVSRTLRVSGIGDLLEDIEARNLAGYPIVLVNPRVAVPTGRVFAAWDGVDHGGLGVGGALDLALAGRNDLQAPATTIAPVITDVLDLLAGQPGAELVRMSGSGATCFALFDAATDAATAAERISMLAPDWWVAATELV